MSKVALITGITGQDGSYLAELLLSKGYKVHGIVRRVALEDETHRLWRIRNILNDITLHAGSLESYASLFKIILKINPNEVYHLAALSYVGYSFEDEFSTLNINIKNRAPTSKPHWKDQWRWRCTHRDALKFAKMIIPYAKVKREKLQQIIKHYEE